MENERHWFVYRHTNKINGKMYIGITGTSPQHRWGQGYAHCSRFNNAIKKYGWENFEHEVLIYGLTKAQAEEFEQYLIKQLKTQNDMYGYNITSGGKAPVMTPQTKKKISIANMGHGDRGGGAPKRSVICEQKNLIFPSCSSAARWCGSNSSHISQCCSGKLKSVKGYHWKYVSDIVALTTIESIA